MSLKDHDDLIVCDRIPSETSPDEFPWAEQDLDDALDGYYKRLREKQSRQKHAEYAVRIENEKQQAKERLAQMPPTASKAERVHGIRANRKEEKLLERQNNQQRDMDKSVESTPESAEEEKPTEDIPMFDRSVAAELEAILSDP